MPANFPYKISGKLQGKQLTDWLNKLLEAAKRSNVRETESIMPEDTPAGVYLRTKKRVGDGGSDGGIPRWQ